MNIDVRELIECIEKSTEKITIPIPDYSDISETTINVIDADKFLYWLKELLK